MEALKRNAILSSPDLNVDVQSDTVVVSGKVDSYHKRYAVVHVLRNIKDIKTVRLNVYVELPAHAKISIKKLVNR